MLDAARHDDKFACFEPHVALPKLHPKAARDDQEHLVLRLVAVPDERPLKLDQLHQLPVQLAHDLRLPMRAKERQLLFEINFFHSVTPIKLSA